MDTLPGLPSPFPQLDFPATEQLRQAIVREYRAMLEDLQQAIGDMLETVVEPVVKSQTGYAEHALGKQNRRRDAIISILTRLGVPQADFADGGRYANTSDEALRDQAKQRLADVRRA